MEEVDDMREDIVETVTNLILSKDVYKIVFSFIRLEYTDVESNLRESYIEYKYITPEECKINEYFRMDETSPLMSIYKDASIKKKQFLTSEIMSINFDGDYGRQDGAETLINDLKKTFAAGIPLG